MATWMHHDSDLLFVYGTLRRGSGHAMAAWLADRADWLGPAACEGARLYRVSWYPALAPGDGGEPVRGDLYRLRDPAATWPGLDAFEAMRGTDDDEYACGPCRLRLGDGRRVDAHTYWYRLPVTGLLPLPGGDWLRAMPATPFP